jgi:hypothetical protein
MFIRNVDELVAEPTILHPTGLCSDSSYQKSTGNYSYFPFHVLVAVTTEIFRDVTSCSLVQDKSSNQASNTQRTACWVLWFTLLTCR